MNGGVSVFAPWPSVPVDEYGYMRCPIPGCGAELHLIRTYCIPLVAEQSLDHEPEHAVTNGWAVECTNDHRIHDHVDQARYLGEDETADEALEYDHFLTHERIHAIAGGAS